MCGVRINKYSFKKIQAVFNEVYQEYAKGNLDDAGAVTQFLKNVVKEELTMRDLIRLPIIDDDATKEEITAAAEELLALETDIDLQKGLQRQTPSEDRRVAG